VDILSLVDAYSYEDYIEKAHNHDVVAVLINQDAAWSYVHFAFIDPENPSMVYQRADLERDPEHTSYETVLEYAELFTDNSEVYLAFLDKKD
jgi:Tfp pilus assembly protein PilE